MIAIPSTMGIIYYSYDHMYNITPDGNVYILPPVTELMYSWENYKYKESVPIDRTYKFGTKYLDIGPLKNWELELIYDPPEDYNDEKENFYPLKIDIGSYDTIANYTEVFTIYPIKIVAMNVGNHQVVVLLPELPGIGVVESAISAYGTPFVNRVFETTVKAIETATLSHLTEEDKAKIKRKIDNTISKKKYPISKEQWSRIIIDMAKGIVPKASPIDSLSIIQDIEFF